jgi:ribonuclease P protein component
MEHQQNNTFVKKERLCSKKQIAGLFESGKSVMAFPVRVQYILVPETDSYKSKVLFSVPKKKFKRAVKRNLIRRRMREAYRLNKIAINAVIPENMQLIMAFIYVDAIVNDYLAIEKGVKKAFEKLSAKLLEK